MKPKAVSWNIAKALKGRQNLEQVKVLKSTQFWVLFYGEAIAFLFILSTPAKSLTITVGLFYLMETIACTVAACVQGSYEKTALVPADDWCSVHLCQVFIRGEGWQRGLPLMRDRYQYYTD